MKKILIAISILAASCGSPSKDDQAKSDSLETKAAPQLAPDSMPQISVADSGNQSQQPNNTKFTYNIINGQNNTFGYDIYMNGKISIHQNIMPGLPGNNGFKTKAEAEKVAELVMYKMQHNIMPPTVTKAEMDSVFRK